MVSRAAEEDVSNDDETDEVETSEVDDREFVKDTVDTESMRRSWAGGLD